MMKLSELKKKWKEGGKKRWEKVSPEERTKITRAWAKKRWSKAKKQAVDKSLDLQDG